MNLGSNAQLPSPPVTVPPEQRVYARRAVLEWIVEQTDSLEGAVELLKRQFSPNHNQQPHFLVRWAWPMDVRRIHIQFTANYLHGYLRSRKSTADYHGFLARAYFRIHGLQLPDEVWLDNRFCRAFKGLVRREPQLGRNDDIIGDCPYAQDLIQEVQQEGSLTEWDRARRKVDLVLRQLNHSLPSETVVERLLGSDVAAEYRSDLEQLENGGDEIDVDAALRAGENRSWSTVNAEQRLTLLQIYMGGEGDEGEIAQGYDRYCRQKRANISQGIKQQAQQLGVWRIRPNELQLWKDALIESEWRHYQELARSMKEKVPKGVFTQIPRRKFNPASLLAMRQVNIRQLEKHFDTSNGKVA